MRSSVFRAGKEELMKPQHEFEMARTTICDFPPLQTRRRYRAYLEMLEKVKAEEKVREEDAE